MENNIIESNKMDLVDDHWKVMIVDDEKDIHTITKIALSDFAFEGKELEFLSAYSGKQAIELMDNNPDIAIILLDVIMEKDDSGLTTIKHIRDKLENKFVRIILRTGAPGEVPERKIVANYDINDYKQKNDLTEEKLYTSIVSSLRAYRDLIELDHLRNHLESMVQERNKELKETLTQLAFKNKELEQEQEFAKNIFSNILNPSFIDAANIKYLISPMSVFNGDLLLVTRNLSGGQYIMIGDFTGHGLKAAIGAIPVSDIVHAMTEKGHSIEDIMFEVNAKLKKILPTGVFFCACFIEIDTFRNKLRVWNGGMPDVLIYRQGKGIVNKIKSSHLPLGIVREDKFDKSIEVIDVTHNDQIFLYSDGVIELENQEGEMFSEKAFGKCFKNNKDPDKLFNEIIESHKAFGLNKVQQDDITFVEISFPEPISKSIDKDTKTGNEKLQNKSNHLMKWKLVLELNASLLRIADPIPMLMQLVINKPEFEEHKGDIFTLLSELLTNSLDHGLLGLSSSIKNQKDGFAIYYKKRLNALATLESGSIKVDFEHIPIATGEGGRFIFKINDTGPGFDYEKVLGWAKEPNPTVFSGRGIMLVNSLCEKLSFSNEGRTIEAVYVWK